MSAAKKKTAKKAGRIATVPASNGHAAPKTRGKRQSPLEQEIRELKADVDHWRKIANAALDRKR